MNSGDKQEFRKNVFYINVHRDFWIEVARNLAERIHWAPCYWVSPSKKNIENIKKYFPNVIAHEEILAIRGLEPKEMAGITFPVIDEKLHNEYSDIHLKSISMMDMLDPEDEFSLYERNKLFYRQFKYWLGVVETFQPDIVVFSKTPHKIYDFILYSICKRKNIRTVLFEITALGRLFIREDYESDFPVYDKYKELLKKYNENEFTFHIDDDLQDELSRLQRDYKEGMPYFMEKYF